MSSSTALSLFVIVAAAVLAPTLAEVLRRFRIPAVLFEIVLGIVVGPSVLGWVQLDQFTRGLAELGLAMLFFMAGYEINFAKLKGTPMNRAGASWIISLGLGLVVATVLRLQGVVLSSMLIGLALTTTALGTLLPILRDRGVLRTPFGNYVGAAGAVGEFGPVVAITLLFGAAATPHQAALLLAFVVLAGVCALLAGRPQGPRFTRVMERGLESSTQLPVRVLLLLVVGLVLLATRLGLDNLLGAFAAGMIARIAVPQSQVARINPKLDAVTFGFFIPVFFVVSGVRFHLDELADASTLARMVLFVVLMLAVRGLPALIVYRGVLTGRARMALVFLQATALPLLVVITEIGLSLQRMKPSNAAALVGAGMLSVLIFPIAGMTLLAGTPEATLPDADNTADFSDDSIGGEFTPPTSPPAPSA
ncbi:MAG: cation:proton antiporter [Actinomycetes bacterium]